MLNVLFRADSSAAIGVGHVMRCANLAGALKSRGVCSKFVTRRLPGNVSESLRARGFEVEEFDGGAAELDAERTRASLEAAKADWLVVDHYSLDCAWEAAVRPSAKHLMAIEDLPSRRHECELLLDHNATGRGEADYRGRVPEECLLALGPRYALLDPSYVRVRSSLAERDGRVRRILISFGGSDPSSLTERALRALCMSEFSALEVDVVLGANYHDTGRLRQLAAERPRTRILQAPPTLVHLLADADLAIGGGGTTMWERLCLGVPAVVVCMAENQRMGCEYLARESLIEYCGPEPQADVETIASAVRRCTLDPVRIRELALRGQVMVDGFGAQRIAEYLAPTAVSQLRMRHAESRDMGLYFGWVNDAQVRRQSLSTAPIGLAEHRAWFSKRLAAADSRLFVMMAGELPVGQIRFDVFGGWAQIDFSIDGFFRGRRWASKLLDLGVKAMPSGTRFRGEVKQDNPGSCAAFLRAGFRELPAAPGTDLRVFTLEASR